MDVTRPGWHRYPLAGLLLAVLCVTQDVIGAAAFDYSLLGEPTDNVPLAAAFVADGSGYFVGVTRRPPPGQSAPGYDAYLQKFDGAGKLSWSRQFGTPRYDQATVVNAGRGYVRVAGQSAGTLTGQPSRGGDDAFLIEYDITGQVRWAVVISTAGDEQALALTSDAAGNAYLAGATTGAFSGQSSAGGRDAFVQKFGPDGTLQWTRQFGTAGEEQAAAVAADDSGNVYVGGSAGQALLGQTMTGNVDGFVRKYDAQGADVGTQQFGSTDAVAVVGLAVDARSQRLYIAGQVSGELPGQQSSGSLDSFLMQYDLEGRLQWTAAVRIRERDTTAGGAAGPAGKCVCGRNHLRVRSER